MAERRSLRVATGFFSLILASSAAAAGCGDQGAREDGEAGDEPTPPVPAEHAPSAGGPNELDHDRLFQCDPESPPGSTPERLRRLSPGQFKANWRASKNSLAAYGTDEEFEYSTDARNAGRVDDSMLDETVRRAILLGKQLAEKRVGWPTCMRQGRLDATGVPTPECLDGFLKDYLARAWQRPATSAEIAQYAKFGRDSIAKFGSEVGIELLAARPYAAAAVMLRIETAGDGLDAHGRERLSSFEIAEEIAQAVTDSPVNGDATVDAHLREKLDELHAAAQAEALDDRPQVEHHLRALLTVPTPSGEIGQPQMPGNVERFIAEYLGYPELTSVFKNGGDVPSGRQNTYYSHSHLLGSAAATVAAAYQAKTGFLRRLLSGEDFYLWPVREGGSLGNQQWPFNLVNEPAGVHAMPAHERAGMLTHPAWLATHGVNSPTDGHPIHRGLWIREKLLCGAVPPLPMSVDAQLPAMPSKSVRERLEAVTTNASCWGCHKLIDPLGIPFETYDHYGRYRTVEVVGDGTTVPVTAQSTLVETGDPALDGVTVNDGVDLARRLAGSPRVEECFVRHTFRFFVKRPETYADACTLVAMRDSFRQSDQSLDEMLVALVTSDTVLYRSREAK
jgi:hypothetical protein